MTPTTATQRDSAQHAFPTGAMALPLLLLAVASS
jgi:hypothetical protein